MNHTCELLVKVHDGSGDGADRWRDGMVVTVGSPGVYFSTAEVDAWLNGNEPREKLARLGIKRRREMRVWVDRTRALINMPVEAIARTIWPTSPLSHIDDARERKNQAIRSAAAARDRGWDSTWGYMDLCSHMAIGANLTMDEIGDLVFEPEDVRADPLTRAKPIGRRILVLPWRSFVPDAAVPDVEDPDTHVPAFRHIHVIREDFELEVPA